MGIEDWFCCSGDMRFGQQSSCQAKFKQNLSRAFLIDHNFYVFLRFEPMIWSLKTKSFCEKHLQEHFITFVSFWRHVDVNFRFFSNSLLRQLHKGHKTRFSQHTKMFYWDVWVRYLLYIITGLFFIYFRLFKNTLQFLQQINMKKCPSSIQCKDLNSCRLEHESPPITTRPGLPPYSTLFC